MRSVMMGLLAFVATTPGTADEMARRQYEALTGEFEVASKAAYEAYNKAATDEDRMKAASQRPQPRDFAQRFFALAEAHRADPVALDALTWVASRCVFGPEAEQALGLLARDHGRSERLVDYCGRFDRYGEPFKPYEKFLQSVQENNPHREVQALACVGLATYLKMVKERTERDLLRLSFPGDQPVPKRLSSNLKELKERDLGKLAEESARLFERVIERYPEIRLTNNIYKTTGGIAKAQLSELRDLSLGSQAPGIEGEDIFGTMMRLGDYRGKVVVLDFGSHRRCGPCRAMYPFLRTLVKQSEGKPFVLLGINIDDDRGELKDLVQKGEITWRAWWDGEGLEGPIAARWIIRSWPTVYILDHKGVIRNKGFLHPDEINGTVNMLLKELETAKP
jgi:thiol-disulfide isomerase/thioredoxin